MYFLEKSVDPFISIKKKKICSFLNQISRESFRTSSDIETSVIYVCSGPERDSGKVS